MTAEVKICGLKTAEAMEVALAAGADYVGLVAYPPSPRHLALEAARLLAAQARGRARVVVLVVDADDRLLGDIVETVAPDYLQLHGNETPARARAIKARTGCRIIKVAKVETAADVAVAATFAGIADLVMFDAKAPSGLTGALPGGNGLTFDWHALDLVRGKLDFMLAGGLTPSNVAAAIHLTGARAVDVSSGVESQPGVKDPDLIRRFVAAAKAA